MAASPCPSSHDLERLLLGQATGSEMQELEQHFLSCSRCVAKVQAGRSQTGPEQDVVASLLQRVTQMGASAVASGPEVTGSDVSAAEQGTITGTLANPMGQRDARTMDVAGFLSPPQAADEMGRLGGYRVLKVLGRGGMGVVFQAHDPKADRQIALKVMLPSLAQKPEACERFLREARATAKIEHDHIVPLYQVSEDHGVPFLAMPLLKGMTLEDWLERREKSKEPVPLAQILRLGREIALGLAAAHAHGLIHRDIKPANVWLDASADSRVKILDFGLARPTGDAGLTQPGMIVGTASYMPPEQAKGENVDARADLYSLGCVMYRLCAGRLPFAGHDAMSVLIAATTETARPVRELNPNLPPALADLVMQLLAKTPAGRPASARDVASRLQALERQLAPIAADGTSVDVTLTLQSPRRPRRLLPAALALLVFGAVAAGAVFYVQQQLRTAQKLPEPETEALVAVSAPPAIKIDPIAKKLDKIDEVAKKLDKKTDFDQWVEETAALLPKAQMPAVVKKLREHNPRALSMSHTYVSRNKAISEVSLGAINLKDLTPLLPLTGLKHLSLHTGNHGRSYLTDLSPLKGLALVELHCGHSRVTDLTPLNGMGSLRHLDVDDSPVKDLTPLKDLRLRVFSCEDTEVTDLTPVKNAPLEELHCSAELALRHALMLQAIPSLRTINNKPKLDFFKATDAFERWVQATSKLTGEKQLAAVVAKLKEHNPTFDAKVVRKEIDEKGVVRLLDVSADGLLDLAPLRALPGLRQLRCAGSESGAGALADLKPLSSLKLKDLHVGRTRVRDLTPLAGMPLTRLAVSDTLVEDLSLLQGTQVLDVACQRSAVRDLTPLQKTPLQRLSCDFLADRDVVLLRAIPTLEMINDHAAKEFLTKAEARLAWLHKTSKLKPKEQVEAVKELLKDVNPRHKIAVSLSFKQEKGVVTEANLATGTLSDVSPLRAFKGLKRLTLRPNDLGGTEVKDLRPLVGLNLEALIIDGCPVESLTPLAGMSLRLLHLNKTLVRDLTPLQGMELEDLSFQGTAVRDLTPLSGMALRDLKYDLDLKRDAALLGGLKELQRLNDKPVGEVLKTSPPK